MRVNLFEGGRRLAKLATGAWVALVVATSLALVGMDGINREEAFWIVVWVVSGCVVIWLASMAIGWVMRGFLGAPPGQDFPD